MFDSLQEKWYLTCIAQELHHKLSNGLRLRILEKEEFFENLKNGRRESLVPSHQSAKKNLILIVLILRLAGQFLFIFCVTKYILNEKNANKSI